MRIKKIKPMFTAIVTTMNVYEDDVKTSGGLIDVSKRKGSLKEYQTVLSIGTTVRDINVGDVVWINPQRFAVKKHKEGSLKDGIIGDNPVVEYSFDTIVIDGKTCLLLQDRDIEFIVEEYEEEEVVPESKLIHPPKTEIITDYN